MSKYTPIHFFFVFLFLIATSSVHAQVSGCKDPAANNYDPSATVNDGNCNYNITTYTPPVRFDPMNAVLAESSGLQMAGGFLWSFNDGGGAAAIYRIDTASSNLLQTVNLGGTTNVDWEDIAFDGTSFYIGDFGNNDGDRPDLKIYKFPLSAIPDYTTNSTVTIPAGSIEVINFTYSDQTDFTAASNNTKFDCEAMIVDGGKIHLFTKNWINVATTHYLINDIVAGTYVATPLETLSTGYLVTAADISPNGRIVALLGYQGALPFSHYMHLLSDFNGGLYFNGNKRRIDLPIAYNPAQPANSMGQAEGIAFRNDTYGYISNERISSPVTVTQKLRSFTTSNFTPAYVLPLQLQQFAAIKHDNGNEISWRFSEPVKDLVIEHSTNRSDFVTLKRIEVASTGNFIHQAAAGTNCYRLVWKTANGASQYSDVVCVNNKAKTSLSNAVLRHNGELTFVYNSNETIRYSFRLVTTDGKVVAQTKQQVVSPGLNRLSFPKPFSRNAVLLLQAVGTEESKSLLLKVQ